VLFSANEISLQYQEDADPSWVEVDPTRLIQVVGNLLQNAAKFTPRGGHVVVSLGRSEGQAVVRVRDDGAGIEEATLARLFKPFMQAETTLDRTQGGLGLGLALAKNLVELHGGHIVGSSFGIVKGSEFLVSLPLAAKPAAAPQPRKAAGRVRRHVLVIEDNQDRAATLRELLEMEGHKVTVAHDGQEGLNAAVAEDPDVVLCDLGIPVLDGHQLARRLWAAGSRARLVAFTGYTSREDVERALEAGFDDHLAKPPDLDRLFEMVERPGGRCRARRRRAIPLPSERGAGRRRRGRRRGTGSLSAAASGPPRTSEPRRHRSVPAAGSARGPPSPPELDGRRGLRSGTALRR